MSLVNNCIIDNKTFGNVGDFLKETVKDGSEISIVSAYFTIFAYYSLHNNLDKIKSLRFLFGEPTFIQNSTTDVKNYKIEDDTISVSINEKISQKKIAQKCAQWLLEKAEIKSIVKPNFLHGKMYYVDLNEKNYPQALCGSSNFTMSGLGLKKESSNIELNLVVDSDRQKEEIKNWFDAVWNDKTGLG